MVILRPTAVGRGTAVGVTRGTIKPKGVVGTSRITRPGPLVRKSPSQIQREKLLAQGYTKSKVGTLTEMRAPKTVRYGSSWDSSRPRGQHHSYSKYSPKSLFYDQSGVLVKSVERGVYKSDIGNDYWNKSVFNQNVINYGQKEGYQTKKQTEFRGDNEKVRAYKTNYYVDDIFYGRDYGTAESAYRKKKFLESQQLQKSRSVRKATQSLGRQ